MTLRRMLERASEARATFEDTLDRLNAARPVTAGKNKGASTGELFAHVVGTDLARALADIRALDAISEPPVIDGGVLVSEANVDAPKQVEGSP